MLNLYELHFYCINRISYLCKYGPLDGCHILNMKLYSKQAGFLFMTQSLNIFKFKEENIWMWRHEHNSTIVEKILNYLLILPMGNRLLKRF